MATNLNISTNYVGEVAGDIIGKAFKDANTLSRNLVDVLPNVSSKLYLRKIDYTHGIADYACSFTPTGTFDFNEVILEPKKLQNKFDICKEDFRVMWDQAKMGYSAHNDGFQNLDESKAMLSEVLSTVADKTDYDIWNGVAGAGSFDGFLPQLNATASTIKVTGTASTEANVLTELKKALSAIPQAIRKSPNLKIVVSGNIALNYQFAVGTYTITNGTGLGDSQLRFGSFTLDVVENLPDNTIVAYDAKNLKVGLSINADFNEIRVKDMDEVDFTGKVRFSMAWAIGTAIVRHNEVVLYKA